MKISVVIPTYKPDKYIYECLESLNNQTFDKADFEVIIVLNGCNEPWYSALSNFISTKLTDLKVNFIQVNDDGVSNARNIGMKEAKGDFITFIDDDDFVSPEYLKELYSYSDRHTVALSDALSFEDKSGKFDYTYGQHQTFLKLKGRQNISLFSARKLFNGPVMKLIHRDIIAARKFEETFSNGEDSLYMFLISDNIRRIRVASDSAVYYRRVRANSATTRTKKRKEITKNRLRMCVYYSKYFLLNPFKYNILFLLSRYAGSVKTIFYGK